MHAAESQPVSRPSLQENAERLGTTHFIGGPVPNFERVGRLGFEVLLREGLVPSSRVLDVGCGALRLGYWLMRFLDPGCYFGIEPAQDRLQLGLNELIEADVVERAGARFSANEDFDFSVFDVAFDFVIARSIWTHASRSQISAMLRSFAAASSPNGVFLASYYPASPAFKLVRRWPQLERRVTVLPLAAMSPLLARLPQLGPSYEYLGEEWVGRSHESDDAGVKKHSLRWIADEASSHGLKVQLVSYPIFNRQYWLRVTRARETS